MEKLVPGISRLAIETRSLPALARSYPRHFTFYVANPISSIASRPHCKHLPEMIPGFGAGLVIETRSLPNLLVATLATLPSMSLIPSGSILSRLQAGHTANIFQK
jgi:hypothetical protein